MSKVLVVDDEESIRSLLRISLSYKGYEVLLAENGTKGVEVFEQERPSVVLTDIKMPGIDGIEVLREIKRLDPNTEVIVITGHGEMETAIQALQLEASDFINKPITDAALSVALKRAKDRLWMKQKLRDYTTNLELMVKEATEDLKAAHDFQENLIQSSIDGIIAKDRSGTIIVFNEGAERLLGYSGKEVIGETQMDAIYPPGVAETINETLHSEACGGKDRLVNYESLIVARDGEAIPVRISGTTLFENGNEIGAVHFFQDLREIKRLQQELIQNERLSAIGQTVAGMAHYIKNILNGLQGGVYIVNTSLNKNKPELLPKGWTMVQNNIAKVSDLTMNMLSYSREREPDYESCSPNDIAQQVYDLMQERAKQFEVRLVKDFDLSLNECYLDPDGVHRCLLNLVTNAIDACAFDPSEDKDFRVVISTRKEDRGVRFDVVDNGAGITPEIQAKLFERFFSTKGPKGTGLGLLVTRKIVDEHGGTISFESNPGEGTSFSIRFPDRCEKT